MTLTERIREANPLCEAVASNGDTCLREAHDPDEMHRNGFHVWGSRNPFMPAWRRNLSAKDMTGRVLGRAA